MNRILAFVVSALIAVALAQPRAYKDVYFGDSLPVVAEKIVQHEDLRDGFTPLPRRVQQNTTAEDILRYAHIVTDIGDHTFRIRFDFFDSKLYTVTFASSPLDASFFNTYVRDAEATLTQVIVSAHGPPNVTIPRSFLDLQNGFVHWTARWDSNSEGVDYNIGLARRGYFYYAVMAIEWTWLSQLRDEAIGHDPEGDIRRAADDF